MDRFLWRIVIWWAGIIALFYALPYLLLAIWGFFAYRNIAYSQEIQLEGGAKLVVHGTQESGWDGDACATAGEVSLEQPGNDIEPIFNMDRDGASFCLNAISDAAFKKAHQALYVLVDGVIWSRPQSGGPWKSWTPVDGDGELNFVSWNPEKRVAVYTSRREDGLYRLVYRGTDKFWRDWQLDPKASRRMSAPLGPLMIEVAWVQLPRGWHSQLNTLASAIDLQKVLTMRGARLLKRRKSHFARSVLFAGPQLTDGATKTLEIKPQKVSWRDNTVQFKSVCDGWDAGGQTAIIRKWVSPYETGGYATNSTLFVRFIKKTG